MLACGVVGAWVGYVANTKRSCCTYVGARGIARSWMRNGVISRPEVLRWSEVQTLEQAARKDLMEWSTTHALRFERTDGTTFEIEAVELPGAEPEAAIHFVKAAEQSYRKASPERPGAR